MNTIIDLTKNPVYMTAYENVRLSTPDDVSDMEFAYLVDKEFKNLQSLAPTMTELEAENEYQDEDQEEEIE